MKALVDTLNQEKALVGAFSVIVKTGCGTDGSFYSTSMECRVSGRNCGVNTAAGARHRLGTRQPRQLHWRWRAEDKSQIVS